ncbi:MAG TPA: FliH/SctL family protein [archaeon]|nr:FliH/SctL family protein [archaeon]
MIVLKTKAPLKRVFIKSSPEVTEFVETQIQDISSEVQSPADDPQVLERIEKLAEERLEEVRAQSEKEAAGKIKEAYEKGKAEGAARAQEEIAQRAGELASVIAALKEARENLLREAEKEVVDLVLAVARKFVNSAALMGNDLIKQTIKSAVKMITEKEKVIIRINPDDLEEVRAHQDDIIFVSDGIGKLEIRADKSIDRGGCVVETEAGNIDARIESRFSELEKALRQVYGNGKGQTSSGGAGE